jgi:polar amino acid transport system substrate-binding protein
MTKKIIIFISILLLFTTLNACRSNKSNDVKAKKTEVEKKESNDPTSEKIITAVADPWPPFVDPSKKSEGLSLEIIRAAYDVEGYKVEYKNIPWARAVQEVTDGKYDILPDVWYTKDRISVFEYGEKYADNELKFIKKKGDHFEFEGLKSLKGKTIGIVKGYAYSKEFLNSNDYEKVETTTIMQNIKKVISNRVDLTLEDKIVASALIMAEDPSYLEQIEFTNSSLESKTLHIAAGKKNPRSKKIIDAYNKGLKIIKENGKYKEILKKYGL